ncbi:MAG: tRNA uridine-5-carboxymethylaminomethyl(34) synthesis GTPase MnmE [Firmicutes bacterium]|nr:tRNA uridine-5-carboxymethylaminomethyl(34) synthesis GTPase MnmE [Bacillota bacterium]
MEQSTIAAIATAPGESGIGIVRMSGPQALTTLRRVFRDNRGRKRERFTARHLYLGYIVDEKEQMLDQVLVSYMPGPTSYTGEDIVAVNSHGGALILREILSLLLRQPEVRLAEPGEFTQRAFLNGKLDLMQAEAVIDLIQAKSKTALQQAGRLLRGELSQRVLGIREQIVELLATAAASIDFPEQDIPEITSQRMLEGIGKALQAMEVLLSTSFAGRVLREGLQVAIVGRPNVGKSSLLNALVGKERAIVTDIAGTTRDVIEEYFSISGIPIRLLDTAGMRETEDPVERIGVALAEQTMRDADLVLMVIDQSQPLQEEDGATLDVVAGQRRFIVLNKSDLPSGLTAEDRDKLATEQVFQVSAVTLEGLDELRSAMADLVVQGVLQPESPFVANARQEQLLREAASSLQAARETVAAGWPLDMVQVDLQAAADRLGEMVGLKASADLAREIFSRFCIGK